RGSAVESRFKIGEKGFAGVFEGAGPQRREGELADAVQLAPNRRFNEQQGIAAGEIDRFIRRIVRGSIFAGHAPASVKIDEREIEEDQLSQPRTGDGLQKST